MAKSKVAMLEEMGMNIGVMNPLLTKAGCQSIVLIDCCSEQSTLPATFIREGYKWLAELYSTVYADVVAIRRLLPEEHWDRHEAWGEEDLREVIMLKNALILLRKAWISQKRPAFFKKVGMKDELQRASKKINSKSKPRDRESKEKS